MTLGPDLAHPDSYLLKSYPGHNFVIIAPEYCISLKSFSLISKRISVFSCIYSSIFSYNFHKAYLFFLYFFFFFIDQRINHLFCLRLFYHHFWFILIIISFFLKIRIDLICTFIPNPTFKIALYIAYINGIELVIIYFKLCWVEKGTSLRFSLFWKTEQRRYLRISIIYVGI